MKISNGERRMTADEGDGYVERQLWMWVNVTHPCNVHMAHDKFLHVERSSKAFRCTCT
jgi:hypothetical protein